MNISAILPLPLRCPLQIVVVIAFDGELLSKCDQNGHHIDFFSDLATVLTLLVLITTVQLFSSLNDV
jgi:hypothetical protein